LRGRWVCFLFVAVVFFTSPSDLSAKVCKRFLSWSVASLASAQEYSLHDRVRKLPLIVDTVVVLAVRDGKLLYGRRQGAEGNGTWGLLGGKIENAMGESVIEAADREFFEESGMGLRNHRLLDVTTVYQEENSTRYRVFMVLAEALGDPQVKEGKIVDFQWRSIDEPPEPLFTPNADWMIPRIPLIAQAISHP